MDVDRIALSGRVDPAAGEIDAWNGFNVFGEAYLLRLVQRDCAGGPECLVRVERTHRAFSLAPAG